MAARAPQLSKRLAGGHGVLRGELSTELTEAALATGGIRALRRSGFCGMHTQARERGGYLTSGVAPS